MINRKYSFFYKFCKMCRLALISLPILQNEQPNLLILNKYKIFIFSYNLQFHCFVL